MMQPILNQEPNQQVPVTMKIFCPTLSNIECACPRLFSVRTKNNGCVFRKDLTGNGSFQFLVLNISTDSGLLLFYPVLFCFWRFSSKLEIKKKDENHTHKKNQRSNKSGTRFASIGLVLKNHLLFQAKTSIAIRLQDTGFL